MGCGSARRLGGSPSDDVGKSWARRMGACAGAAVSQFDDTRVLYELNA